MKAREQKATVQITRVHGLKVWVEEGGVLAGGDKRVIVQHDAPGFEPVCYCTFHYDYRYTSNSMIRQMAERMALQLGATKPVEFRSGETESVGTQWAPKAFDDLTDEQQSIARKKFVDTGPGDGYVYECLPNGDFLTRCLRANRKRGDMR